MPMEKAKVVYTDNIYADNEIENQFFPTDRFEFSICPKHDKESLVRCCKDADAVLVSYAEMTAEVIEALEKCKVIVRGGMGVNNVDIPTATKKGIMVANVQKYCIDEVSDHAMAFILALVRKISFLSKLASDGVWNGALARPIPRIRGLVLSLYGLGQIAGRLAEKAKAFGMDVVAFDPYVSDSRFTELGVKRITDEQELFKIADVLSVHVPLMESTRRIITKEKLSLLKESAYFINVARGGLVDEQGLIEVLRDKRIAGAGLDVLEDEYPSAANPLLQMDSVLVSPHVAYYSEGSDRELRTIACTEILQALEGKRPEYLLNNIETKDDKEL